MSSRGGDLKNLTVRQTDFCGQASPRWFIAFRMYVSGRFLPGVNDQV